MRRLIFFILMLGMNACSAKSIVVTRSKLMMGHVPVNVEVKTSLIDKARAIEAQSLAFAEGARLEKQISEYQEESEVSCLNRQAAIHACDLSESTLDLLQLALEIYEKTQGAFNIRFSSPTIAGRQGALFLDRQHQKGKLFNRDTRLGVGSLGKGWIVDAMLEKLKSLGFPNALIHAGGDLRATGGPWRVAIHTPFQNAETISPIQEIYDEAWASSGDEEQGGHIIDPKTGEAVQRHASVTLRGQNLTMTNVLATTAYVLGPEASTQLLKNFPEIREIIWVNRDGKMQRFKQSN